MAKKRIILGIIVVVLVVAIYGVTSRCDLCGKPFANNSMYGYKLCNDCYHEYNSSSGGISSSQSSSYVKDVEDLQNETKDWMKEQAEGKDYSYDDGGEYYCMGKNDTCPNKTRNAYDLYCDSCDPDGD